MGIHVKPGLRYAVSLNGDTDLVIRVLRRLSGRTPDWYGHRWLVEILGRHRGTCRIEETRYTGQTIGLHTRDFILPFPIGFPRVPTPFDS